MKFEENLTEQEFTAYVLSHPMCNFFQTASWKEYKEDSGRTGFLTAVRDETNGKILAAALVLFSGKRKIKNLYLPHGPLIDFTNARLVDTYFKGLFALGKRLSADIIDIEPHVLAACFDKKWQVIETYENDLTEIFAKQGYRHRDKLGQSTDFQQRYTTTIDLVPSLDTIFGKFAHNKLKDIKRNQNYFHIKVQEAPMADMSDLVNYRRDLAEKKRFSVEDEKHFQLLYTAFKKYHDIKYFRAFIDFEETLQTLEAEIKALSEKLSTGKSKNKSLLDQKHSLEHSQTIIRDFLATHAVDNLYCVAANVDLYVGTQVTALYAHTNRRFENFGLSTAHYVNDIRIAKAGEFASYDLFGIQDPRYKNNPNWNLTQTKLNFGGDILEYVGVYSRPLKRSYGLKRRLRKIVYGLKGITYEE
jgi:lipid II:glycine glycyltransferase (peptidoglycan interpeptide bridge formation enzyme)